MGLRRGRDELNETRARLGLPPLQRFHGGISELLAIVGTLPQLEYPRDWPAHVHVTGPLFFELPGEEVELPDGEGPLVLIAPSTSQDPECELLRVALEGLAGGAGGGAGGGSGCGCLRQPTGTVPSGRSRCRGTRCCWTGCSTRRRCPRPTW